MIKKINKLFKFYKKRRQYKKIGTSLNSIYINENVKIGKNCLISKRVKLEDNVQIGDFTYLNSDKSWSNIDTNVRIGKFCSIAPGVNIGAGNHDYTYVTTHPILFDKYYESKLKLKPNSQKKDGLKDKEVYTYIGNDVWIGLNAVIKRGIVVGNGSVIAAGAVVVKDVPDYAIVGGNPAKIIKYRTTEENINYMKNNEKDMWWNWEKKKISDNIDKLYDFNDYIEFIKTEK